MEYYGFCRINMKHLIGHSYGRVLRVSLIFCYKKIEDTLDLSWGWPGHRCSAFKLK
jgi:hypothetical protein